MNSNYCSICKHEYEKKKDFQNTCSKCYKENLIECGRCKDTFFCGGKSYKKNCYVCYMIMKEDAMNEPIVLELAKEVCEPKKGGRKTKTKKEKAVSVSAE